jgi:LCP family protein required for cell wall assembly
VDRHPIRSGRRRPGIAALLSAVFPGAGQFWLGWRAQGVVIALPILLAVVGLVLLARGGAMRLAAVLVQPRWLWMLIVFNIVVALLRVAAVADAWRLERPALERGWRSYRRAAPAVAVTIALLLPQVIVHRYAVEALDLLNTVFVDETKPLAERIAELEARGVTGDELGPEASTVVTGASTSTTTTSPEDAVAAAVGGDRVSVLLAGGDFGPGRQDLRTDVMIVAVLDLKTRKAALIGISRDLVNAPLPEAWAQSNTMIQVQEWHEGRAYQAVVDEAVAAGEEPPERAPLIPCNCYADRINYLHVHTANWVRTFPNAPDPGMEALRQTVSLLLDIPIDYYSLVDFGGFVDLVDALGGIEVNATEPMHVTISAAKPGEDPIHIEIAAGPQRFDGRTALAYVRNREGSSDSERMRRQRCMLKDLAAGLSPTALLTNFGEIASAIKETATTTLPLSLLPQLVQAATGLDPGDVTTMAVGYPAYTSGLNYMGLPIVDVDKTRSAVAGLMAGLSQSTPAITDDAADECD